MSDINEEGIGLGAFHFRKERAAEMAIEKIRHNLGNSWQEISSKEIDILNWALGETWAMMGYHDWDNIAFGSVNLITAKEIVEIGNSVVEHKILGSKGFEEIHKILDSIK